MRRFACSFAFVVAPALVAACSSEPRSGFDDGTPADDGGVAEGGAQEAGGFAPGTPDGSNVPTKDPPREVYGHSRDTLYRLDPETSAVTLIGKLEGCGNLIDLAINQDGAVFGASSEAFYAIDKGTGRCEELGRGTYPTSLSFVPDGTFGAGEALVGYEEGVYVRIDTKTGAKTSVGDLGGDLVSSGDIVSVKDGPTFLTVKPARGAPRNAPCSESDCLVEVDPKTGRMLKNWKETGYKSVFGLAFWGGDVYGFTSQGEIFKVTLGGGLKTMAIAVPGAPTDLQFWGAGSSTLAPIGPR